MLKKYNILSLMQDADYLQQLRGYGVDNWHGDEECHEIDLEEIDYQSYEELAKRTAPSTEQNAETGKLILSNLAYLHEVLHDAQHTGMRADTYKRAVFYKKGVLENCVLVRELEDKDVDLTHAIVGLIGESGELAENWLKHMSGPPQERNEINLREELGDLMWYIALACNALGVEFADLQAANINKLKKRYPDKYSNEAALARADKDE